MSRHEITPLGSKLMKGLENIHSDCIDETGQIIAKGSMMYYWYMKQRIREVEKTLPISIVSIEKILEFKKFLEDWEEVEKIYQQVLIGVDGRDEEEWLNDQGTGDWCKLYIKILCCHETHDIIYDDVALGGHSGKHGKEMYINLLYYPRVAGELPIFGNHSTQACIRDNAAPDMLAPFVRVDCTVRERYACESIVAAYEELVLDN